MALKTMIKMMSDARAAFEQTMDEATKTASTEVVAGLAAALPAGYEIVWMQYTPYFNDGDACTFSVNDPTLRKTLAEVDAEDDERDDDEGACLSTDGYDLKNYVNDPIDGFDADAFLALASLFKSLPEDLCLAAFGDHVKVVVRSDGTHAQNDHEHD